MERGTLREVTEWARNNEAWPIEAVLWAAIVLAGGGDWEEFNQHPKAAAWRWWVAILIDPSRLEPLGLHEDEDFFVRDIAIRLLKEWK